MVREGELVETDTLSELGIFGAFLRRGDKVLLNREAGHLIRTKVSCMSQHQQQKRLAPLPKRRVCLAAASLRHGKNSASVLLLHSSTMAHARCAHNSSSTSSTSQNADKLLALFIDTRSSRCSGLGIAQYVTSWC